MAYNFLPCARDQAFLLLPDLRDWLPGDQLAWFVLDVVDELDLDPSRPPSATSPSAAGRSPAPLWFEAAGSATWKRAGWGVSPFC
jgi:hypothetical protein